MIVIQITKVVYKRLVKIKVGACVRFFFFFIKHAMVIKYISLLFY